MLSAQFWMGSGATVAAAAVMGLGLGSYVTSPQAPARAASATIDADIDGDVMQDSHFTADKGPGVIHCTGCGPTLADRRWKADMAGLDADASIDAGYDPALQDNGPQEDGMTVVADPPVRVYPLPPQVTRLASGDTPPPPVAMTRSGQEAAPPLPVMIPAVAERSLPR